MALKKKKRYLNEREHPTGSIADVMLDGTNRRMKVFEWRDGGKVVRLGPSASAVRDHCWYAIDMTPIEVLPTAPIEHDIEGLTDASMALRQWADEIATLIKIYGPSAIMRADGGHNNVGFVVTEAS